MRTSLLLVIPLLLSGSLVAQDAAPTPEELILKLGSNEYAVREDATKKLTEMGEKAVPALEKALNSEDVEVRMRAGRALRAIRADKNPPAAGGDEAEDGSPRPEGATPPAPGSRNRSYSIEMSNGRVKVRVQEMVNGKQETREYEGESLEQLKKDHPELNEILGGFQFRVQSGQKNPFDMDIEKFWRDWNSGLDDDFWKDFQREQERSQQWFRRLQEQRQKALDELRQRYDSRAQASLLGVRVSRPEEVLDAQLELRGKGLVIESVEARSAADRLGIQRWDILIELNGAAITAPSDVATALRGRKPEDKLTAAVVRRGRPMDLKSGE